MPKWQECVRVHQLGKPAQVRILQPAKNLVFLVSRDPVSAADPALQQTPAATCSNISRLGRVVKAIDSNALLHPQAVAVGCHEGAGPYSM